MSRQVPMVVLLLVLSGIAGLGYQVAWTRLFAVGLGHEMAGLLAVVTAFFAGLGIGGLALDGRIARSRVPGRWYAGLEVLIAVWAVVLVLTAPTINGLAHRLMGADPTWWRQWSVAFGLPLVALLPATAAMGATLPAAERLAARIARRGSTIALLYGANTLGAALGILVTTALVIPALGLTGTVLVLAGLNLLCAVAALLGPAAGEATRAPVAHAMQDPPSRARLALLLAATGLLGIGWEVAGVRVLALVLENTVYTYAGTVAVFLVGTAGGAALWHRFGPTDRFAGPATWLLQAVAGGIVLGLLVLPGSRSIFLGVRDGLAGTIGRAPASIAGELATCAAVFLPATLAMGATFSHLVLAARHEAGGVGRAAGINTIAGAVAPALVGLLAIPTIGSRWTIVALAAAYLPLVPVTRRTVRHLAPGIAAVVVAVAAPVDLALVTAPPGMRFIDVREGVMATVAVAEDATGGRIVKVNDQFSMGGTTVSFADRRQGHVPMLLHPAPERALFLGVGAGLTAGAATLHGDVHVTAVELVPEVLDVLPRFAPMNRMADVDRFVAADARRYVRASDGRSDVIVADLFHPARDGAGNLYTREHFEAVRARLADGGLFCQWLALHQLDARTVAMIVRTFLDVFPDATGWFAAWNVRTPMLGLVGTTGDGPLRLPADVVSRATATRGPDLAGELADLALSRDLDLLGMRVADTAALRALAGEGPRNLDDRPRIVHQAPWYTYATVESGLPRVSDLLALPAPRTRAADLLEPDADPELVARLDAYGRARDAFLAGMIDRERGGPGAGRARLLEALRASPDFGTARALLLSDADRLARSGARAEAEALLRAMLEIRPDDPAIRALTLRVIRGA